MSSRERHTAFARELRQRQTDAESLLWRNLRRAQHGIKFRRQHLIGDFIVDFYCSEARLAVEVDGGQHAGPTQSRYDRVRTELLDRIGVKLLRFGTRKCCRTSTAC